jgi:hypothetical protein
MGVAGVIDMDGIEFEEVWTDNVGRDSLRRSGEGTGGDELSRERGRGDDKAIGTASGRESDRERRRGGDAGGGPDGILRDGDRPR